MTNHDRGIIYKMTSTLPRRVVAEFVGTAFLVAAVIGSGIMAERLSAGNVAIALLANSIATGAALMAIILAFGGISGAHFNPAVSVSDMLAGGLSRREAGFYVTAQFFGGLLGTAVAHLMFSAPVYSLSLHPRHGAGQLFSEFVAAFGLMAVIWGCSRSRANMVPFAVAAYITGHIGSLHRLPLLILLLRLHAHSPTPLLESVFRMSQGLLQLSLPERLRPRRCFAGCCRI